MIKNRSLFYTILFACIIIALAGCSDNGQGSKDNTKLLENNVKTLEDVGKIRTFPLTIVIADKISGDLLPQNMQTLSALSKYSCKTLPIAGILRLGSNNYYEYNNVSSLEIAEKIKNSESEITDSVEKQVARYQSTTKVEAYDSLLKPNHEDWDMQALTLDYIGNSADSIFFFSENAQSSGIIQLNRRSFPVYNNIVELRRKIDEIICMSPRSISVFYTPPPFDTTQAIFTKSKFPARGTPAGDTCVGYSKYQKVSDGFGGFILGNQLELQSQGCGFKFPTGLAGDTCVSGSKYQKLHNGKGGFALGNVIEKNSKGCGFMFPPGPAGDTCVSGSRYQKLHDGKGGFAIGTLKERNSKSCGFTYPTGIAGDTCVRNSKYQKLHNGKGGFSLGALIEANSASCGFKYPTGPASGDTCVSGSRYQKMHNGRGGFAVGALKEKNSTSCGFAYPTGVAGDTCVSGSKYQKLHNGRGGFSLGKLLEKNSNSCGFKYPTGVAGDTCVSGSKYQKLHNGRGGFILGNLLERNSSSCGFKYPTGPATGDSCVGVARYQKLHNGKGGFKLGYLKERSSKACGFTPPAAPVAPAAAAAGTPAAGYLCDQGSKYAKMNDGKGGFVKGALIEANSKQCAIAAPPATAPAARVPEETPSNKGDAVCEKDAAGNYTGRRVQYYYNKSGKIIRTVVISKCDSDCRCLGN